jgi:hypothetical protein
MRKALTVITLIVFSLAAEGGGQTAGYVDCYGGVAPDGEYWPLLDHLGRPLEDGDWVYAAWTGPDGQIDPPDDQGYPTGDDVKLPVAAERIEYSSFLLVVATWEKGYHDESGQERHPMDGELMYCRIFDDPKESVGPRTHYSDSQRHPVVWKMGDVFFCQFPGDPGAGRAATKLKAHGGSDEPSTSLPLDTVGLRQIPPHLRHPTVELEYVVPDHGPVTLTVHDRTGRQVAVLVDARKTAGLYLEQWDGGELPAGIYVAVLKTEADRVVQRIIFLR